MYAIALHGLRSRLHVTKSTLQTFNNATLAFYNSAAFKQVAAENAAFLNSLPPFLDGRPVSLENMVSHKNSLRNPYDH